MIFFPIKQSASRPNEPPVNWKKPDISNLPYLDLFPETDQERKLAYNIYDQRVDFNCQIVNFPYLCGSIPAFTAYSVYVSQLI